VFLLFIRKDRLSNHAVDFLSRAEIHKVGKISDIYFYLLLSLPSFKEMQ